MEVARAAQRGAHEPSAASEALWASAPRRAKSRASAKRVLWAQVNIPGLTRRRMTTSTRGNSPHEHEQDCLVLF